MSLTLTAWLAGLCLAATVLFGWLGARPPNPMGRPRLIPWRMLMLLAFTVSVAVLGHAVAVLKGS